MILDFLSSFFLGLLTPLSAVCVLPLYPGFISYLAGQISNNSKSKTTTPLILGIIVTSGILLFMLLLGITFTTIFKLSLTKVIGIISPIAFVFLGLISITLILDFDIGKFLPKLNAPIKKNSYLNALFFGFFFGAIIIPCNPGFIGAFFARSILFTSPLSSITHFLMFGIGVSTPLLIFSIISSRKSQKIINFIVKQKTKINRISGIVMLIVSIYYLFFVFKIFG